MVVAGFVESKRDKRKRKETKIPAKDLLPVGVCLYQVKNENKMLKSLRIKKRNGVDKNRITFKEHEKN